MEFKRIDENKFQCRLLKEDLEDNNITLDDFFRNDTTKIHNLVDVIMEEAKESIGIDLDGNVMSLQLAPQPDHSIVLTISAGRDDFNSMLKQAGTDIAKRIEDKLDKVYKGIENTQTPDFKDFSEDVNDESNEDDNKELEDLEDLDDKEIANVDETKVEKSEIEKNNKKSNKPFKNRKFVTGIFVFDSLDNLEEMCNRINKTWGVINSLYKNDGKYYLIVEKGKCNSEKYANLLNVIIEHGKIYGAGKERVAFVEEHFTPFIKDNAINRIKRYL